MEAQTYLSSVVQQWVTQGSGGAAVSTPLEITRLSVVDAPLKEPVATLLDSLNRNGSAALESLRGEWLSGRPQRAFVWHWVDLTGDGRDELVALWVGRPSRPELAEVAVINLTAAGQPLLLHEPLSTRQIPVGEIAIVDTTDLTGDQRRDVLLLDQNSGRLLVVAALRPLEAAASESVALYSVPETCQGSLTVRDTDGDGLSEIVRDGCDTPGRVHVTWDGESFILRWDADLSW